MKGIGMGWLVACATHSNTRVLRGASLGACAAYREVQCKDGDGERQEKSYRVEGVQLRKAVNVPLTKERLTLTVQHASARCTLLPQLPCA